MQDSSKKTKGFDSLVIEHFKKTKQYTCDSIHILKFDRLFSEDLIELKKNIGSSQADILLLVKEPQIYDPGSTISEQWLKFKDLLLKYQIFNCNFFITCYFSDSAHDNSIKYLNTNHYDWSFFKFNIGIIPQEKISTINELENNNTELFLEECRMKFSHLNFTHRMHRQLFSKFLIKNNLVKDNLVSINPERILEEDMLIKQKNKLIEIYANDGWFYNKHLIDLWRDVPLEHSRHPDIDDNFGSLFLQFLNKASFNIVSETVFDYPFPRFTEKTIQSFLSKRPFIMIGPYRNLQHCRNQGFKTFHTIIDESYDVIQNPNERLEAIMQLVLDLNKKSQQELNDMVYAVKDVLIHNCSLMVEKIRNFTNIKK